MTPLTVAPLWAYRWRMPRAPRSLPLLLALAALAGCAGGEAARPAGPGHDLPDWATSAPVLGALIRAGQLCDVPVSTTALDRAARIEAAAIELHERQGGMAARDDFLHAMAPPGFDAQQHGHDKARWCAGKRAEIERADGMLGGESGRALLQRAEAARASFR